MAIAFVKNGGVYGHKTTNTATPAITVPAGGHAAGNLVVVGLGHNRSFAASPPTSISLADSKGNAWTLVVGGNHVTIGGGTLLYASVLTTPLVAGDTITATFNVAPERAAMAALEFSGAAITVSGTAGVDDTGTAATVSTTPADAATVLIGLLNWIQQPTTSAFTQDADTAGGAAWATGPSGGTSGGSASANITLRTSYKITTSAVAQTWSPTGTTGAHGNLLVALKEGAPAALPERRTNLLVVGGPARGQGRDRDGGRAGMM